jgi:hypothetical protein
MALMGSPSRSYSQPILHHALRFDEAAALNEQHVQGMPAIGVIGLLLQTETIQLFGLFPPTEVVVTLA